MERDDKGQFVRPYRGGRMSGWARGMDNRRANVDIPVDVLRNAVNVDILTSGKARMRRGISQAISDAGAHSLWAGKSRMLWGTATTLNTCTTNLAKIVLATDPKYAQPISFVEVNGDVYFSNGLINGKVTAEGVLEQWGIVGPSAPPTCTSLDSATTKDREYMVTCVFVTADGEESGAPTAVKVLCGQEPIIGLTNVPQSSDARVVATRVYVSEVNGTMMYAHSDIPTGVTMGYLSKPFSTHGKKLDTMHMSTIPPGHIVEYYNGRLYVAADNIVYFTDALRYGLHDSKHGYYMFPERVTLLKAVDDGLFVSSDTTYFLDGSPKPATQGSSVSLRPVLPYKAVEGASCNVPNSHDVMWLSERGIVRGGAGGQVANLTEDQIAMDQTDRAALGVLEIDGFKGVMAIMRESRLSPLASDDYVESEVERLTEVR